MKRIAAFLLIAIACAGLRWAAYQAAPSATAPLSKFVPAGPLLYLEAKDFNSLLAEWNRSSEKQRWTTSTSYEVFSDSRLFLRLKAAGDQFAAAGGIPPDMTLLTQVAGERSALAVYDIGKMQFLYVTHLPSARSMQTALWQTRAKFEPRSAGNVTFYVRRDAQSDREVAFAISGDYLLLATRADLLAGALQLMSNGNVRSVESEEWWNQGVGAVKESAGDLRMVLDLAKIVPNGYFRTYWVQQNITDLSHYSAAVCDLYRSGNVYREERVLIRKAEPESRVGGEALAAAAEVARLVPSHAGWYQASAGPSAAAAFDLVRTKLLEPHLTTGPAGEIAPQVQLADAKAGEGADLETRIDQPVVRPQALRESSELQALLEKTPLRAALQVQSTMRDPGGVFIHTATAVALVGASEWNEAEVRSAISEFVRPDVTAGELGVGWQNKAGYKQLDGLLPVAVAVRGNYLLLTNDTSMLNEMLANFDHKSAEQPADLLAGFDHARERPNFTRFADVVDHPSAAGAAAGNGNQPQFFSGTIASLSASLAGVAHESIAIRGDSRQVHQTVTYQWLP